MPLFFPLTDTPSSLSARLVSMIWSVLTMMTIAAFTAQLIRFFSVDVPQPYLSGIDDPRVSLEYLLCNTRPQAPLDLGPRFHEVVQSCMLMNL